MTLQLSAEEVKLMAIKQTLKVMESIYETELVKHRGDKPETLWYNAKLQIVRNLLESYF